MRTIRFLKQFTRDYKRELKGRFAKTLDADFNAVLALLLVDASLPPKYRDHQLSGSWSGHRDCHVHPDLVLIYRKPDTTYLDLVRLGSHSELRI